MSARLRAIAGRNLVFMFVSPSINEGKSFDSVCGQARSVVLKNRFAMRPTRFGKGQSILRFWRETEEEIQTRHQPLRLTNRAEYTRGSPDRQDKSGFLACTHACETKPLRQQSHAVVEGGAAGMSKPGDDEKRAQPRVNSPSRERGFCVVSSTAAPLKGNQGFGLRWAQSFSSVTLPGVW